MNSSAHFPALPRLTVTSNSAKAAHTLYLLPAGKFLPDALPELEFWQKVLKRKAVKPAELVKTPLVADLPQGGRAALVMIDPVSQRFDRLSALRKALMPLLEESPETLALLPLDVSAEAVQDAVYVALVNGVPLPAQKKKPAKALKELLVADRRSVGNTASADFSLVQALARANLLARELTALPPNQLDPAHYRQRLRSLAKSNGWGIEEFDFRQLKKMGAGAFCAVAQGSDDNGGGAAIVRLSWRPKKKVHGVKPLALVGKGICYDTGGHNLKPAKYMAGMHEDMNGSAVALAILAAAAELELPVAIDCWLAIAKNHISPAAYAQGDIVRALNGTTIEVMHTDAEGRMVLADTLALAVKQKPQLLIDFATLTGSMHTALGQRYSGVFASDATLAAKAVAAGSASGERVCVFPQDADYEAALDSKVADIKQCTLEGDADHILATRFLGRFVGKTPWLHVDLSAASCTGGLGAVGTDLTGFGVAWAIALLQDWTGDVALQ
ncbi:MAG: leucyl aminopeptidase family protein [Gammaproteobacteria bacterium]|nr:leucyl aminopeptidase family protein [Rhodocyclaceae bacterium]MBU3909495.1 leucyl aminopeptidase family protein [Gammaproteobacteria bacterium]MBU3987792.1 leucyl aminopeptidase family protein [Gammaproteobacteria bacterium]MBU4003158.1 leucyl aminopeptidase family protein [Gammaproteobacteria bacterium]MBU4022207.1 leucyl aminopeptidase family protein [Gammaproteobacteria bacterium]